MDIKEKVTAALTEAFVPEEILLDDEDGISGYVVSDRFRGMPLLERQGAIRRALREPARGLTKAELRHVLAIAALTPVEFASIDLPDRPVHGDR